MFNWKTFEKTKAILSQDKSYQALVGQHHVTIRPAELSKWIELASEDLGFFTLVEVAGADLSQVEGSEFKFDLTYHLINMGTHQRLNIHVLFDESETVPSIIKSFAHADWLEREQQEALGITFNRNMKALLLPENQNNYPLRKITIQKPWPIQAADALPAIEKNPNLSEPPYPEERFVWKAYDTFSPITSGQFEMMVCFDPTNIVRSKLSVGFHHQALEKMLEQKDWQQVLHLVDKIHIGAAPTYSTAWAKTLEDVLRIKIPERGQAIRIVMLELVRIAEHFTVMHEMTYALGLEEHKLFINLREKVYELIEKYCGRRQGLGTVRLGGVKDDLPHGWIVEYQSVCDIITKNVRIIHGSLISQRKFRDVLNGAYVSAQTALEWGISGPSMRAAGLNFDLRKSQPFYFYQDIDFDVPVGIHGTAYERYLIRYEEILQSFRIITQVIDNLPLGEVLNPSLDKDYTGIAETIKSLEFPKGWQFSSLESPNGEAGFLVKFNSPGFPYRVKIKTPSTALVQAIPQLILGIREDQLKVCLLSLGIRPYEMDR